MAPNALIGCGYIGQVLNEQLYFDEIYNSKSIGKICRREFNEVWCAAPSGTKWLANKNHEEDTRSVSKLIDILSAVKAKRFILISTVDVFRQPAFADENTIPKPLDYYGQNRLRLEKHFFQQENSLVVRLPGLVGGTPKKGPLFDIKNLHRVEELNPDSYYQWYPLKHLVKDCLLAMKLNLGLAHFTTPPVSIKHLCGVFGKNNLIEHMKGTNKAVYSVKTVHNPWNYTRQVPWDDLCEAIG